MNKASKIALIIVASLLTLILFCWGLSALFLTLMKLDIAAARPHTIFLYAFHYHDHKQVQDALFMSTLFTVGGIILLGGAGISLANKETIHGCAKWATLQNITKAGLTKDEGILLGKFQGKFLRLPGELFAMVAAPTRSGKGVGLVIPNLLSWPASVVVLDVKFENYEITSGFRKKHGQEIYLFNPAPRDYRTHRYNPLGYISQDRNHRIDDIQKIANFLVPTPKNSDPMWTSEARDLFFGIVLYLLDHPDFPVTLGEVLRQLKSEKETAEYFAEEIAKHHDSLDPACIASLSNFIDKAQKERSRVRSTLSSALNLWSNPLIDAATSANDFDLRDLRKRPMTIYIGVTPDNLKRMASIVNMFIQHLIDLNMQDLPAKYDKKGNLLTGNPACKHSVLLLLDEFTAIGRLEILENAIAFLSGYGLRMMTIIQSPSQLRSVYGHDVAETFQKNHHASVVFRPKEMKEAQEIANELGFKTIKQASIIKSGGLKSSGLSKNITEQKRQLLLPQEVKSLVEKEAIILVDGVPPIRAKKIRYYEDSTFTARLFDKVTIQKITPADALIRGKNDRFDLSSIDNKAMIQPYAARKMSEGEIAKLADDFYIMLIQQATDYPDKERIDKKFTITNNITNTQRHAPKSSDKEVFRGIEKKVIVQPESGKLAADAVAKFADSKGSTSTNVTGDEPFRRETRCKTKLRGNEVPHYALPEQNKSALDKKRSSMEAVAQDSQIKQTRKKIALTEVYLNDPKNIAIKKHLKLKPLYALEAAAVHFANHSIEGKNNQKAFSIAVRDHGLDELSRGKKLPELKFQPIQLHINWPAENVR